MLHKRGLVIFDCMVMLILSPNSSRKQWAHYLYVAYLSFHKAKYSRLLPLNGQSNRTSGLVLTRHDAEANYPFSIKQHIIALYLMTQMRLRPPCDSNIPHGISIHP